ncbi:TIM barrel protein [Gracilibacillus sp. YIM 98692]|uniref:sugar phosphate isomerase/epimerase family protein n=1 Tax=Gracilibacillus sp. YIM 98692 TaxID=2663532 RepID=UPI0013D362E7|nr:TIM barrel protein [Gracilibacillus sp. YIM 98692]
MTIEFGISTGFAIKRWADPKEWAKVVKEELGLEHVQFSFDQFDPRAKEQSVESYCYRVQNECEKHGITIQSTFAGLSIYAHNLLYHPLVEGRMDGADWFAHAFHMTKLLGVQTTGGPIGGMDVATFHDSQKSDYVQQHSTELLIYLLTIAKQKYGIEAFYWEPTPVERESTLTIEETEKFVEDINQKLNGRGARLSLCFDIGHTTNPKLDDNNRNPLHWIETLDDKIDMIHLQQTDGYLDRHYPFTEKYNRDGMIRGEEVLQTVKKNTTERLYLEIGHAFEEDDQQVLNDLIESVEYWKNTMKRMGCSY